MQADRDLQLLLLAFRDRVIDPHRLAEAAGDWAHGRGTGLMAFLAGRGVLSPDDLHRLEAATTDDLPAAASDGGTLPTPAPHQGGGHGDATTDHPARGGDPGEPRGRAGPSERYTILRLHQTGGLGQVWLARD